MIDFKIFYNLLKQHGLEEYEPSFRSVLDQRFHQRYHGELSHWLKSINNLPVLIPDQVSLDSDYVTIGSADQINDSTKQQFIDCLQLLHPWRKGPFKLFGIDLDTEWRSNMKWQRVTPHIQPLEGRKVLDIGCGNGYHCWRMLDQNPRWVLGIDPSQKFMMQFEVIKRYASNLPISFLPLRSEDLPAEMAAFDTVLSMGVLYHRKSPFDHLEELRQCLRPGGELILETLVIEGGKDKVLVPEDRYAQMRNVWFIPTCDTLIGWLQRVGFDQVRLVDINRTTVEEQRPTNWMRFHSLENYLDPKNLHLTIEGHPAPIRATFIAQNP